MERFPEHLPDTAHDAARILKHAYRTASAEGIEHFAKNIIPVINFYAERIRIPPAKAWLNNMISSLLIKRKRSGAGNPVAYTPCPAENQYIEKFLQQQQKFLHCIPSVSNLIYFSLQISNVKSFALSRTFCE